MFVQVCICYECKFYVGSLCAVADLAVTTKTKDADVSMTYLMDHNGCVAKSIPSHVGQGRTTGTLPLAKL